jgi:glycosyltransferase involved in cell wall biosynthesis
MNSLLFFLSDDLLWQYETNPKAEIPGSLSEYLEKYLKKRKVYIACNAAFPNAVILLRQHLKTLLPPEQISVCSLPFTPASDAYQTKANQIVKEYFLSQFKLTYFLSVTEQTEKNHANHCCISVRKITQEVYPVKHSPKRPKLAYFSPILPIKSGIASYSSELLPYLSKFYDITLVVDEKEKDTKYTDTEYPILSSKEFPEQIKTFDRLLYHFGNSAYHSYMWPLLKKYPGTVVLHDFFLSGLLSYEEVIQNKTLFWTEQLFKSHGYKALAERYTVDTGELSYRYPCSFEILQSAEGIIVHSDYSRKLAHTWYTPLSNKRWQTIPHLRIPVDTIEKHNARKKIGFEKDDILICSFGMLNATKNNHRLLEAFLNSTLSKDPKCHLVFVGESTEEKYMETLRNTIRKSGIKDRIKITGWTDDTLFKHYLEAADIGVQLRTSSRGETSGTVLDCLNYGLATIVNANGSMADFPKDVLVMLEEDFTDDALREALETLIRNPELRQTFSQKAREHIRTCHNPEQCAIQYQKAIEKFSFFKHTYHTAISQLASLESVAKSNHMLEKIAHCISSSTIPPVRHRQLLVDVSAVVQSDLHTGIQRVVRAQLLALLSLSPHNLRVEPVYLSSHGGFHYRYARDYICSILDMPVAVEESAVVVEAGDIFYGLDFHWDGVIKASQSGLYRQWKAKGVSVNFMVYDLLPIQYPDLFPKNASSLHEQWLLEITPVSNTLMCISQSVADAFDTWKNAQNGKLSLYHPETAIIHLGADVESSLPTQASSPEALEMRQLMQSKPVFLMVSTIEPRKGYLQTIEAFEHLWNEGKEIALVIVGKEGWKGLPAAERRNIPDTVKKLRAHPRLNKELFWLENVSDRFLKELYDNASALIVASIDEGFGLPLIEAAHHHLPVIARDIPVFREVAGKYAYYFPNSPESKVLAASISTWLSLYDNKAHPLSDDMPYCTWEESAQKVLDVLLDIREDDPEVSFQKKDISPSFPDMPVQKSMNRHEKEILEILENSIKTGE